MITYVYTAKSLSNGEPVKAEVQAESESAAAKLLLRQDLVPITIVPKEKSSGIFSVFTNRISTKDRVLFSRQLATLVAAGLPILQSLRSVRDQINSRALLAVINAVIADVEGGTALSQALARHPKVFNQVYISLVAAGEASGSLDKSLERIATQQEKDAAMTKKIRGALIYPAIVLVVIGAVMLFMLTTVLPQVEQLYKDLDKELPLLTSVLVTVARLLRSFWYIALLGLGLGGFLLVKYFRSKEGKRFGDKLKLHVPIFGKLFQKLYMARFARTGGILLAAGLPMLEVLRITQLAINNIWVEESLAKAAVKVKGGKALSKTLEHDPYFLSLVPQMLKIGEDSGTTDQMLDKTATYYEDEIDVAVKNLSTTIEPILMIVLGITVGVIIAAVLLPIYGLVGAGDILGGGANPAGSVNTNVQ